MRRYIVNFKGDGHIIFHGEYTNYHTIEINLSAESLGRPGNNLFTEGETKTFELAVNLSVSRDNGYGEVAGDATSSDSCDIINPPRRLYNNIF